MTPVSTAILTCTARMVSVVCIATGAAALLRLPFPSARLYFWRGVLLLCGALPFLTLPNMEAVDAQVTFVSTGAVPFATIGPHTMTAAGTWLPVMAAIGIGARLAWLLIGAWRLRQLRLSSDLAVVSTDIEDLRTVLAPHTELRQSPDVVQPVTFGYLRPVVLLPAGFVRLDADAQRAVVCHELAHVARRDWLWILGEELVRAILWFNPAIWWVLAQIQLSREQVVDQFVVARTGLRRSYMQALLLFADAAACPAPALPFLRRRHVAARLSQLSKENTMSRWRFFGVVSLLLTVMTGATIAVMVVLPFNVAALAAQATTGRLDVRLAELEPAAGLVRVEVAGSTAPVFLHPESLASNADVVGTRVFDAGSERYSIAVQFSDAAANRLTTSTRGHEGRPVAILLDGQVIAAPTVRGPIGSSAVITGAFSRARADAIAAALVRSAGQQARPRAAVDASGAETPAHAQDPGVVLPVVEKSAKPVYPQAAQDARVMGGVLLRAIVDSDGVIREAQVAKSLDTVYGLDQSALDSLREWRFKPGTRDGRPARVEVEMLVTFALK